MSHPGSGRRSLVLLIGVACATFAVDRVSKIAVQTYIPLGESRRLANGLLYISHAQNTGAAFSLGASFGNVFLLFAIAATAVILYYNRHVPTREIWTRVALGMVMGGALGNAVDRVVAGSVTDFIDFRIWPVFNLADSAIVVGTAILLWRLSTRHEAPAE